MAEGNRKKKSAITDFPYVRLSRSIYLSTYLSLAYLSIYPKKMDRQKWNVSFKGKTKTRRVRGMFLGSIASAHCGVNTLQRIESVRRREQGRTTVKKDQKNSPSLE